jgi:hypothetical protein
MKWWMLWKFAVLVWVGLNVPAFVFEVHANSGFIFVLMGGFAVKMGYPVLLVPDNKY